MHSGIYPQVSIDPSGNGNMNHGLVQRRNSSGRRQCGLSGQFSLIRSTAGFFTIKEFS